LAQRVVIPFLTPLILRFVCVRKGGEKRGEKLLIAFDSHPEVVVKLDNDIMRALVF
jgi:hypothetical protein